MSFINDFSFVLVCPVCVWEGVGGGGVGYSHIRAVRVCAARNPPPPILHFSAWAAPKDSTFSTWTAPKDPTFQKYTLVCSIFPTWAAPKDPTFKSIRFFVIFSSTPPPCHFFIDGPLWEPPPPIFSEGRSLSFPNSGRHIYIPLSYMSTPHGSVKQRSF